MNTMKIYTYKYSRYQLNPILEKQILSAYVAFSYNSFGKPLRDKYAHSIYRINYIESIILL